jgi:uncharacterized protein (TIGR02118 family)
MIKLIFMFKRKPGLTHEQFRQHYETSHVPLVHKYLSHLFVDYRRNYVTGALGQNAQTDRSAPTEQDIGFDAITELWFEDEAAIQEMRRITSDEAVGRLFYEDELKFFDRAACRIVTCDEIVDPRRGTGGRASPALERS